MPSGTIYGSFSARGTNEIRPIIEWSSTQNVTGNYSDVTASLVFVRYKSYMTSWNNYGVRMNFNIAGSNSTSTRTFDLRYSSRYVVWTRNVRVYHNSNGSGSAYISASGNTGITPGSFSFGGTANLGTIARKSTINSASITGLQANSNATLYINANVNHSGFNHTVQIFDGSTWMWDEGHGTGAPKSSYNIPATAVNRMLERMGSNTSRVFSVRLTTYSGTGGTGQIGVAYYDITAKLNSLTGPTITSTNITEAVSSARNLGIYVQGESMLSISMKASPNPGTSVTSYKIEVDGRTYNGSSITTGIINKSGNVQVKFFAMDSRGLISETTRTIYVEPYHRPLINKFTVERSNSTGVVDGVGSYARVEMVFSVAPLKNKNSMATSLDYRIRGSTTWNPLHMPTPTYDMQLMNILNNMNTLNEYEFRLMVSDTFNTSLLYVEMGTAHTLMNFPSSKEGVALGGKYNKSVGGALQSYGHSLIRGPLTIDNPENTLGATTKAHGVTYFYDYVFMFDNLDVSNKINVGGDLRTKGHMAVYFSQKEVW